MELAGKMMYAVDFAKERSKANKEERYIAAIVKHEVQGFQAVIREIVSLGRSFLAKVLRGSRLLFGSTQKCLCPQISLMGLYPEFPYDDIFVMILDIVGLEKSKKLKLVILKRNPQ